MATGKPLRASDNYSHAHFDGEPCNCFGDDGTFTVSHGDWHGITYCNGDSDEHRESCPHVHSVRLSDLDAYVLTHTHPDPE
jgi:hypothetical protein